MADPKEMPFIAHLEELRAILVAALKGILVAVCATLYFSSDIMLFLVEPALKHFEHASLIGTGPADAFITKLKVAFYAAFILSLPWTFYQIWKFISPGLHDHEKRLALPFVFFTSFFFLSGAAFCFWIVLPFAFEFFSEEFTSVALTPQIRISEYLPFVMTLVVVFGLMFEMPIASYLFTRLGIVSSKWLISKIRYAIVVIFIIAAILTPPDVVTQTLLAIPLCILYGICIFVSKYVESRVIPKAKTSDLVSASSNLPSGAR